MEKRLSYKPSKQYSATTKNRTIKRIAKAIGINQTVTLMYHGKLRSMPKYECIGFHTARRSFCSNLARRGVDIYTIAALANHNQNITMTQRYIIPDTDNLSEEALSFFND
jgi:site-specific recombinase XerD